MGKRNKEAGKRGERQVVDLFKAYGFEARRGRQYKGTPDSPDVVVKDLPLPHYIEVKYRKAINIRESVEQAWKDSGEGRMGNVNVFHRKPTRGSKWLVTMPADDYLYVLQLLNNLLVDKIKGSKSDDEYDSI